MFEIYLADVYYILYYEINYLDKQGDKIHVNYKCRNVFKFISSSGHV